MAQKCLQNSWRFMASGLRRRSGTTLRYLSDCNRSLMRESTSARTTKHSSRVSSAISEMTAAWGPANSGVRDFAPSVEPNRSQDGDTPNHLASTKTLSCVGIEPPVIHFRAPCTVTWPAGCLRLKPVASLVLLSPIPFSRRLETRRRENATRSSSEGLFRIFLRTK